MNPLEFFTRLYTRFIRWFTVPTSAPEMDPRNFKNVQIDAIGVGLASAANPFLSVFLTRLGATPLQVGMLTTMPAITGLLLSIPLGQFLQGRKNIVPWFSLARLTVLSGYALTGIITFFLPETASVLGILGIWALATIPQTILNITFSVVMSNIAGPAGRYELMAHRWSILGFTNSITALLVGQFLDRLPFPNNYQIMFIALSVGGLISYWFSSQLKLPQNTKVDAFQGGRLKERASEYIHMILNEKPFVSFVVKRFVFLTGTSLVLPLFPLYFVRVLEASDSWIAAINTAQNAIVIIGYFYWTGQLRRIGSLKVLIITTFGTALYPILTGVTGAVWLIPFYAAMAGIFGAGLNLVLFDELMKRVPVEYSATFVAAAQSFQYLSSIAAPLFGTWLATQVGFGPALIFGGAVSIIGTVLFTLELLSGRKSVKAEKKAA